MKNISELEFTLNNAIDEFDLVMNSKNVEYTNLNYNEDAIIMIDELARQTSELANKFKDAIINYLA